MPAIIAVLWAAFSRLLGSRLGQWLVQALLFLGIAWGTTTYAVGPVTALISGVLGGASGDAVAWLGYVNVDKAITVILSAHAVRASVGALRLRRRT